MLDILDLSWGQDQQYFMDQVLFSQDSDQALELELNLGLQLSTL